MHARTRLHAQLSGIKAKLRHRAESTGHGLPVLMSQAYTETTMQCNSDGCQAKATTMVESTANGVTQSAMSLCQAHAEWWVNFLRNSPFTVRG